MPATCRSPYAGTPSESCALVGVSLFSDDVVIESLHSSKESVHRREESRRVCEEGCHICEEKGRHVCNEEGCHVCNEESLHTSKESFHTNREHIADNSSDSPFMSEDASDSSSDSSSSQSSTSSSFSQSTASYDPRSSFSGEEVSYESSESERASDSGTSSTTDSLRGTSKNQLALNMPAFHLTSGIGTTTYSSPEQKFSNDYSTSSDIYSAGLILVELLMWGEKSVVRRRMFKTDMHRLTVFQQLRDDPSDLPQEIVREYPQFAPIIEAMLSHIPHSRPTAKELLELPQFGKKTTRELLSVIEAKNKTIEDREKRVGVAGGNSP